MRPLSIPLSAVISKPGKAEFADFEKNLQNALNAHLPSNKKPYANVDVLLMHFKAADNAFHNELKKIKETPSRNFNFSLSDDEWAQVDNSERVFLECTCRFQSLGTGAFHDSPTQTFSILS
jgi:hypothetical protein